MQTLDARPPRRLLRHARLLVLVALAALACLGIHKWYNASGRIDFEGVLANSDFLLVAGQSGRAASVEARAGDIVISGQPLLRFDNSSLRKTLEQERQKLIQLARMLPPEHIRLPDPDDPEVGTETLTRRLVRKGAAEREAMSALRHASEVEAQASAARDRVSVQHSKGQVGRQPLLRAESRLNEAREQLRLARERQEAISRQRATAETAIRRVLEFHKVSGANKLPLRERLDNYEAQRKVVEQLARAVSVAYLAAPFEGTILEVLVRPGENLGESTPCFVLQPSTMPFMLNCAVEAAQTVKLEEGQQCLVRFPDQGKEEFAGYVAGVGPGADPAWREVSIGVLRDKAAPGAIPPGSVGKVSVLLRTPPYTREYLSALAAGAAHAGQGPRPSAVSAMPEGGKEQPATPAEIPEAIADPLPAVPGDNENASPTASRESESQPPTAPQETGTEPPTPSREIEAVSPVAPQETEAVSPVAPVPASPHPSGTNGFSDEMAQEEPKAGDTPPAGPQEEKITPVADFLPLPRPEEEAERESGQPREAFRSLLPPPKRTPAGMQGPSGQSRPSSLPVSPSRVIGPPGSRP